MSITSIAPLPMNLTLQPILTHLKHDLTDFYGDRFLYRDSLFSGSTN